MEPAGACPANKCVPVFGGRRWKLNAGWMARIGYASAAGISACAIAQRPCNHPQALPAYGLQSSRNKPPNPNTKLNPNTMCPLTILGKENPGSGHFYMAENRTFLLCVDMTYHKVPQGVTSTKRIMPSYENAKQSRENRDTAACARGEGSDSWRKTARAS